MNDPIEVLITLPFSDELIKQISATSPRLSVEKIVARKVDEISDDVWKRVEVLYTNRVLPKPEQAPRLRWIQFHWAGLDHALEEPILQREGMNITSMSGASAPQMAEHAVMMMLALGHHLPDIFVHQKRRLAIGEMGACSLHLSCVAARWGLSVTAVLDGKSPDCCKSSGQPYWPPSVMSSILKIPAISLMDRVTRR